MDKDIRAGQERETTTAVSRHTPGPWGVRADRQYFNVNAADGSLVVGEEGFYRMDGEDEANARLVAAAPELLVNLKFAVKLLSAVFGTSVAQLDPMRAAIAKAEGK